MFLPCLLLAWMLNGESDKKLQEEPHPEETPRLADPAEEDSGVPWVDFDWLEFEPRVGFALFTEDYHIDPSPLLCFHAHAPMPWLSPDSDIGGEYFGLWAELTLLPRAERDIEPEPDTPSGTFLFVGLGIDFTLLRNQSLYLSLQTGTQYGMYGGVTDMTDGFASVAGITGGIYMGSGLTLTFGTEVVFAHAGDRMYWNSLGLLIEF